MTVLVRGVPEWQATVKLDASKLEASMSRLNLAVSLVLVATPVTMGIFLAGVVKITRGAVLRLGEPRIGSEPPHATSRHEGVATKNASLIKIFRLEHSRECISCGGLEKSSSTSSVC